MSPGLRKLALVAHVTTSVGWFGAVAAFLALALANSDVEAMETVGRCVIVPACLASFASGVALSLGTDWGLVRHYWVAIKLALTVLATIGLLAHVGAMSNAAARSQLGVDAVGALVVLLVATVLSVWKPRGLTRLTG